MDATFECAATQITKGMVLTNEQLRRVQEGLRLLPTEDEATDMDGCENVNNDATTVDCLEDDLSHGCFYQEEEDQQRCNSHQVHQSQHTLWYISCVRKAAFSGKEHCKSNHTAEDESIRMRCSHDGKGNGTTELCINKHCRQQHYYFNCWRCGC